MYTYIYIYIETGPLSVTASKRVQHIALYPKVAPQNQVHFLKEFCTLTSRLKSWVHTARPSCSLQYVETIRWQIISRLDQNKQHFQHLEESKTSMIRDKWIHFPLLCLSMPFHCDACASKAHWWNQKTVVDSSGKCWEPWQSTTKALKLNLYCINGHFCGLNYVIDVACHSTFLWEPCVSPFQSLTLPTICHPFFFENIQSDHQMWVIVIPGAHMDQVQIPEGSSPDMETKNWWISN